MELLFEHRLDEFLWIRMVFTVPKVEECLYFEICHLCVIDMIYDHKRTKMGKIRTLLQY